MLNNRYIAIITKKYLRANSPLVTSMVAAYNDKTTSAITVRQKLQMNELHFQVIRASAFLFVLF